MKRKIQDKSLILWQGEVLPRGKLKTSLSGILNVAFLKRMLEERKKEKNEWDRDSEEPENSFPMGCERQ